MLLALLACTGPDQEINQLYAQLTLSPVEVDFGEVVVDYKETAVFEVINTGRAPLAVSSIRLQDGGSDVFSVDLESLDLQRDERAELSLSFLPKTYLDYADTLVFESNDPDRPVLEVPIVGIGGDGPTPDIAVDTTALDFGVVGPGDAKTAWLTVSNEGDGDLRITQTTQAGSGAFQIVTDPAGSVIAGEDGGDLQVIVLYNPSHIDGDNGTFTIESNDPDEPVIEITLLGNGGGDFEYPVAIINGPAAPAPPITVALDGSDSYDPNGWEIVDYQWSLTDWPDGSGTSLTDTVGDNVEVFFDIAGEYEVQLKVTNEYGITSAPAKYRVDAIPVDDIHVELIWDTANADLDLHMLNANDAELFVEPGDACFCNPSPSWGGSGTEDDPRLDLDDLGGYGPENINILSPQNGQYPVRVHYFDDNGDGIVTATVRFYLNGLLEEEFSRVLARDEVWNAGIVRWDQGVVIEEEEDPATAPRRSCK